MNLEDLKGRFMLWLEAVKNPKETFSKEHRKADFKNGSINILLGGLIAGLIGGIYTNSIITGAIGGAIGSFIGWLIAGGIYYIFAKLFGGKGDFTTQIYLISLYAPLLAIVTAIFTPVPYVSLLVAIYGLYLLTLALKEAHSYETSKAVLSWFVPMLVIIVVLVILVFIAASFVTGLLGTMAPEYSSMLPTV
ncbi:MAG: Yip1 family protein [Candidatus Undinarchaeales archaeon]